jgi:hypothetical protein
VLTLEPDDDNRCPECSSVHVQVLSHERAPIVQVAHSLSDKALIALTELKCKRCGGEWTVRIEHAMVPMGSA